MCAGIFDFVDFDVKDKMRPDFVLRNDTPVEMRQCAFDFELPGFAPVPNMVGKAFFRGKPGQAGKVFCDVLLAFGQGIDAQVAVGLKNRNDC